MDGDVQACRAARLRTLVSLGRFDEVLKESGPILDWVADHEDAFSRREVLASLAMVETERGEGSVDPAELADLARRTDNEALLIVAAQLALGRGNGDIARQFVLDGAPHGRLRDAYGVARACVEVGLPERCRGAPFPRGRALPLGGRRENGSIGVPRRSEGRTRGRQ